jgi:hypothetical protein
MTMSPSDVHRDDRVGKFGRGTAGRRRGGDESAGLRTPAAGAEVATASDVDSRQPPTNDNEPAIKQII